MIDFKIRVDGKPGVLQAVADQLLAPDQHRLAEAFLLERVSGAQDRFFLALREDDPLLRLGGSERRLDFLEK